MVMVLCVVGGVGTLVWHGFGGDHDKYGRIDVPGSGSVTLPEGAVEIHYAVRLATNGGGGALTVPRLGFTLTAPDGARDPVVTEDIGGTVTVNSAAHVRVWKLQVKDAGDYQVTTEGDVGGFIAPQLTFGQASGVPLWPVPVFVVGFVVALALLLVASAASRHARTVGTLGATPTSASATGPPYGAPSPTTAVTPPSNTTPEQELARLAQLQQLTDLHSSGTLSDTEYAAARARLGG